MILNLHSAYGEFFLEEGPKQLVMPCPSPLDSPGLVGIKSSTAHMWQQGLGFRFVSHVESFGNL